MSRTPPSTGPPKTALSELIRDRRGNRTQADLAAAIGVTPAAVGHWETGRFFPGRAVLPRLAEALHVDVARLDELIYAAVSTDAAGAA